MRLGHGRRRLDGPFDPYRQNHFDLLRFIAASRERGPRLGTFTHKRALRILPAYATVITLVSPLLGPMVLSLWPNEYRRDREPRNDFRSLLFVQQRHELPGVFAGNPFPRAVNGSPWTLPIELTMHRPGVPCVCWRAHAARGVIVLIVARWHVRTILASPWQTSTVVCPMVSP